MPKITLSSPVAAPQGDAFDRLQQRLAENGTLGAAATSQAERPRRLSVTQVIDKSAIQNLMFEFSPVGPGTSTLTLTIDVHAAGGAYGAAGAWLAQRAMKRKFQSTIDDFARIAEGRG